VDDYLEFCKERGEKPEKPFSGKFVVRISPALHRAITLCAAEHKESVNAYVREVLEEAVETERKTGYEQPEMM
jgi:predicted HicB family RNase H-like nuclease